MAMEIEDFYPVVVRESRYMGTYSGGDWVLMAGCRSPEQTEAFGSDVPCMEFWIRVREEGPVIQIDGPHRAREVYVTSGDFDDSRSASSMQCRSSDLHEDPSQLIDEAKEYLSDYE